LKNLATAAFGREGVPTKIPIKRGAPLWPKIKCRTVLISKPVRQQLGRKGGGEVLQRSQLETRGERSEKKKKKKKKRSK